MGARLELEKQTDYRPGALPDQPGAFTSRIPWASPWVLLQWRVPHSQGDGTPVPGLRDLLQTVQQTLQGTSPGSCLCLHYRKEERIVTLSPVTTNNKK